MDDVQSIALSKEELEQGRYGTETLAKALSAMHQDGLVVLKDVIPVDIIDKLNAKMCEDAEKRIADPSQGYNHGIKSNILQRPPICDAQYLNKEIYFNSFLLQVANAYLGHKPMWNWLTSNVALANTGGIRQPVHKDSRYAHPLFPYFFIANVPLCDFTIENGATEFWLGSHAHTTAADQVMPATPEDIKPYPGGSMEDPLPAVSEEARSRRMQSRPPIQPLCRKGDIMIRDLRTWHAGMPNSSAEHRVMLGLGYQSPAHGNETMHVHLPKSQEQFFKSHNTDMVEVRAKWYEDDDLANTQADTVFDTRPSYIK
ncbi:hypothetical protein E8E14_005836 [Neopestalotiopsis sp. 37M]|nr:hypothetical protein E8E14_005836 [Neopestalotiopsis sp. 37M]